MALFKYTNHVSEKAYSCHSLHEDSSSAVLEQNVPERSELHNCYFSIRCTDELSGQQFHLTNFSRAGQRRKTQKCVFLVNAIETEP